MALSLVAAVIVTGVPGGGLEAIVITVESSARVNIRKKRGEMHLASEIAPEPVPAMMALLLLGSSMAGHLPFASNEHPTE